MCGRFANAQSIPQYRAAVRNELPNRHPPTPAPDADDYTPSHNVAPQTRSPVVRRELSWERERRLKSIKNPTEEDRKHQLIIQTMKWGLIPRFHKKPPSYGEAYKTINARDDTLLSPQRSMWHPLLPSQRCVVFVQGFYEWQKRGAPGDGEKVERIPHFVGMTEPGQGRSDRTGQGKRLMPLAGLWERVRFEGEKKPLYTFTIVTTASNSQLGFLHDRMPVILPTTEAISTWLGVGVEPKSDSEVKGGAEVDDSWSFEVAKLLRPLQSELDCYKVPKEVGKVGNSDPSFILPIEERKDGLKAFFAKQKQPKQPKQTNAPASDATGTAESSSPTKKEEQQPSQDSESLWPSSFEDSQALLAAQQAEEEAAMAEAAARVEQEEQDRKMAEQMQREIEQSERGQPEGADMSRSESIVVVGDSSGSEVSNDGGRDQDDDSIPGEEVGDGFGVPEGEDVWSNSNDAVSSRTRKRVLHHTEEPSKRARTSSTSSPSSNTDQKTPVLEPSSRFSPDPYNPPLSPPRPCGGYSRRLSPASGGGVHVNPPRGKNRGKPRHEPFPQAPPHTWKSPPRKERGPMDEMLEKQRQVAQRQREADERAWRDLSPSRQGEDSTTKSASPTSKKATGGKAKNGPSSTTAGTDIRSFFSPQKKSNP